MSRQNQVGSFKAAAAEEVVKLPACGHARHSGTCPHCQRAQLERWRDQLTTAGAPRRA